MSIDASTVVAKTREYLRQPAVVGHEQPFFDHLEREFSELGCEVERHDNLLAVWRDGTRPQTLSVHIDRHGLVGTGGGEYEYAAFVARLGSSQEEHQASRKMLEKIRDRFLNEEVFAYVAQSGEILEQGKIGEAYFCGHRLNLVFQIDGFENLPIGTPVAFSPLCQIGEERLTGQLDNVISAAFVYVLFALGFTGRALFTAEEEIGKSWTFALDYLTQIGSQSQELLVMDTSPFPDEEAILEGAVVLRNRDANGMFNAELVARTRAICTAEGIPFKVKDEIILAQNLERESQGMKPLGLGSTELGRLVTGSKGQLNGITLQLPTFGYHSNRETTSYLAVANLLKLLSRVLNLA